MTKTIYLSGPIADCSDEECKKWRDDIKKSLGLMKTRDLDLKPWFNFLDPMCRDYRNGYDKEKNEHEYIVKMDLLDISQSDIVLVYPFKPSIGTAMEAFYAFHCLGKMVIIVHKDPEKLSCWYHYHSHFVVKTFDEALSILDFKFFKKKSIEEWLDENSTGC